MDSSNSGSIQSSSSGGDDDYDSRTEAISSFLNLPPPAAPPPLSPSHHLHQHPSPSSFISLSPYLNTFPSTPSDPYPLSLDMAWAKSLPSSSLSEPGCTILGGLTTATSSSSTTTTTTSSSKTMAVGAPSHCLHSGNTSLNPSSVQLQTQPGQPAAAPRGSKKRSRASRRAPTTVLTTDTSNFRAMVQEFTGFPAAPFISSPFSRPRLDLFPAAAAAAAAAAPPYLLRPFPQKVQAPLFAPLSSSPSSSPSPSSSVAASIARSSTANANTGAPSATCSNSSSSSTTSSSNYQWPSIGLRHPNLLNTQSPNFTFQSPLQPPPTPDHNSSTMPAFGGASDFAARGLGSLLAMEGTKLSSRDDGFSGWAGGSASEGRDRSQLRSVIGNYGGLQLVSSHAEKESGSMTAARGEGRVDSWILSSD